MGFDPSDSAAPYVKATMRGGATSELAYHWKSSSTIGISHHDGKSKALQAIQNGLNEQDLSDKAEAWGRVRDHVAGVHKDLAAAYAEAFEHWSGDDADRAKKTFGYTVDSAQSVHTAATGMATGTSTLVEMAKQVKALDSSGPSLLASAANVATQVDPVANLATGGGTDFDGGGDNIDKALNTMINQITAARAPMPTQLEWQTKTAAPATPAIVGGNKVPGGGAGIGGVSTPGMSGGAEHGGSGVGGIGKPKDLVDPSNYDGGNDDDPTDHIGDPTDYNPPTADPWTGGGGGGVGGTGYDAPTPDSASTLAGYDPSGGAGLGAGGGAGGGIGGGAGLDAGGGGLAGGSGLTGAGVGGAGAGGVAGGTAAGAGGAGAPGMMAPMRGAGGPGSGDDDERERNTWLSEDEDVWGDSDAPPSVIS